MAFGMCRPCPPPWQQSKPIFQTSGYHSPFRSAQSFSLAARRAIIAVFFLLVSEAGTSRSAWGTLRLGRHRTTEHTGST